MGCDIHAYLEVSDDNLKWENYGRFPYSGRNYGLFAWLTGTIRNYSGLEKTPITVKGVPENVNKVIQKEIERWGVDGHSPYYADLKELASVNYSQIVWNRRVTRQIAPGIISGGCTTDNPLEGKRVPLSEVVGGDWLEALEECQEILNQWKFVRLVFFFDN